MNPHRVKKKMRSFDCPLDFNPTLVICQKIHRSRAISAVITHEINDSDGLT